MTQKNVGEKGGEEVKPESKKTRSFTRLGVMTLDDALIGGMISSDPRGDEQKDRDSRMEDTHKEVEAALDNAG